jgi:hypothetical protein
MVLLSTIKAESIFCNSIASIPLPLSKIPDARVVWVHPKARQLDPNHDCRGLPKQDYMHYIKECCAFVLAGRDDQSEGTSIKVGYADRYGGDGIGHNGGSGRAVFVNGYHVKGVGKTPLVSALPSEISTAGDCLLAECIREAILSKIVANDFPGSAVPVLAIIDTGLSAHASPASKALEDRRALVVRPPFLRPAHFERATGYYSDNEHVGVRDQLRVRHVFSTYLSEQSPDFMRRMFEKFSITWSRQQAYGFVNRISAGNCTTSNVAFNGMLVDFGSMSAVPSWANVATSLSHSPYEDIFPSITRRLSNLFYFFKRHLPQDCVDVRWFERCVEACRTAYQTEIVKQTLLLTGVEPNVAAQVSFGPRASEIYRVFLDLVRWAQKQSVDMVSDSDLRLHLWNIPSFWTEGVPELNALRNCITDLSICTDVQRAQANASSRMRTRAQIFKKILADDISRKLREISTLPYELHFDAICTFVQERSAQSMIENVQTR